MLDPPGCIDGIGTNVGCGMLDPLDFIDEISTKVEC